MLASRTAGVDSRHVRGPRGAPFDLARLGPLEFLYSARITPRDLEQSLARRLTAWLLGATRESARPLLSGLVDTLEQTDGALLEEGYVWLEPRGARESVGPMLALVALAAIALTQFTTGSVSALGYFASW